ncbi:MAG TPA: hypothetical protein VJU16_02225 [Planctomycetota bacterium]|nr:hypothetical protein [Planctomycetota bacterium]
MFADRIRGGAGFAFALLGLLLLRGGPGISESAAAPGCKDDAACYAKTREEGVIGPQGHFVTSHTATCEGDCTPGQVCEPINSQNADGSRTFQCSCDPNSSPAACSGYPTVGANGQVQTFSCAGDCGENTCRKSTYNIVTDQNCPKGYTLNRKCVCN